MRNHINIFISFLELVYQYRRFLNKLKSWIGVVAGAPTSIATNETLPVHYKNIMLSR